MWGLVAVVFGVVLCVGLAGGGGKGGVNESEQ